MAKVSKINIAITGDSKGLAAATDAATRELRRLEAQTERVTKRMAASQKTLTKTGEAMAKLGASSKALGAVSGVLGLSQIAIGGGALGIGAIAGAASVGGVAAAVSAGQQIADLTQRAAKAIEDVRMDARKRIEEQGFSSQLAQAIASRGGPFKTAGQQLGAWDSFFAGLASTRGGQSLSTLSAAAASTATAAGVVLGGGGVAQAAQLGGAQLSSGDAAQNAQTMIQMNQLATNPGGPIGYIIQSLLGD